MHFLKYLILNLFGLMLYTIVESMTAVLRQQKVIKFFGKKVLILLRQIDFLSFVRAIHWLFSTAHHLCF